MARTNHRELLAVTIERFVLGTAGPYEWDDVLGAPLDDLELETIRQAAESIDALFQPTRPSEYCSDAGATYLLQLVACLRSGA